MFNVLLRAHNITSVPQAAGNLGSKNVIFDFFLSFFKNWPISDGKSFVWTRSKNLGQRPDQKIDQGSFKNGPDPKLLITDQIKKLNQKINGPDQKILDER